jgi:hypothetical protein
VSEFAAVCDRLLQVETTKQLQTQFPFQLDHNGGDTIGIGMLHGDV